MFVFSIVHSHSFCICALLARQLIRGVELCKSIYYLTNYSTLQRARESLERILDDLASFRKFFKHFTSILSRNLGTYRD